MADHRCGFWREFRRVNEQSLEKLFRLFVPRTYSLRPTLRASDHFICLTFIAKLLIRCLYSGFEFLSSRRNEV